MFLPPYIKYNNFEEKLNRSCEYLLPVNHEKWINLENNELIDKTKDHYFKFEIVVDYIPNEEIDKANKIF